MGDTVGDEEPLPAHVEPMLAVATDRLPADQDAYGFEFKWDGIRALLFWDGARLRLDSRNLLDVTARYPELAPIGDALPANAVLDGELVALDDAGRPSFSRLQERMNVANQRVIAQRSHSNPVVFVAFDLLHLAGRATRTRPYEQRRELLEGLELSGPAWRTAPWSRGDGDAVVETALAHQMEGVVAKRLDGVYVPGRRSPLWRKLKLLNRDEFVVGGWLPGEGGRSGHIGALLLGRYDVTADEADRRGRPQELVYTGRVGTGFTQAMLGSLERQLGPHRRTTPPFTTFERALERLAVFVDPVLVVEVEYRELTPAGILRQPSFKGVREDKAPVEVVADGGA